MCEFCRIASQKRIFGRALAQGEKAKYRPDPGLEFVERLISSSAMAANEVDYLGG
jgi:hypothetical protein